MLSALISRWTRTPVDTEAPTVLSTAAPMASSRKRRSSDSILQSLLRWLPGESDAWQARQDKRPVVCEVPALQQEFRRCLADVPTESVQELLKSIQRSRNARDLWHLRTWLYTEVAKAHSQLEAEQRLARLSPHFEPQAPLPRSRHRRGVASL